MEKIAKLSAILFSIFTLIILGIIKWQRKDFPLGWIIAIIVFVIIIFVIMFFFFNFKRLWDKNKGKEKLDDLPPPITLEQAKVHIKKALLNPEYSDHSRGWDNHRIEVVGSKRKSQVLIVYLESTPYHLLNKIIIVMNLHYPEKMLSIMIDPTPFEINKTIKTMAVDPEDDPDTEIIETKNPLLGTEQKITKTTKKEKPNKEDKKEDKLE